MKKSYPFWILLLILLIACQKQQKPKVSFYYWKTSFKLTDGEKRVLKENKVSKMYIRYFDVGMKTNEVLPLLPIVFREQPENLEIVPVVFIKNEVMLNDSVSVKNLSHKIQNLISQINKKNNIHIEEIQLDCDWSPRSKDKYLSFVSVFKNSFKGVLSATIRLHQVKYFEKTGIPNVDKGILMYYNMGNIKADDNLIYDKNVAKKYTKNLHKYPLTLNLALPIYSWIIQKRNNNIIALYSKMNTNYLSSSNDFKPIKHNVFVVKNNLLIDGIYYKKGDIIKIETVEKADLFQMTNDLRSELKAIPDEIIFYDLDSINLKPFSDENKFFQRICNSF